MSKMIALTTGATTIAQIRLIDIDITQSFHVRRIRELESDGAMIKDLT